MLIAPEYGRRALADLIPSVLSVLGVSGETNRIGFDLEGVNRVVVLLIDGLGADQLAAHPSDAPFMAQRAADPTSSVLTAGFPTTTAVSLCSVGTGLPSGEHGVVGYLVEPAGDHGLMNSLQWRLQARAPKVLPMSLEPETFQPLDTAFERGVEAGLAVTHVGPSIQNGSGLSRAGLRGPAFRTSVSAGDLVAGTLNALNSGDRSLVYSYYSDLDLVGHVRGPHTEAWRYELGRVDSLVQQIARALPPDAALVVTADHGMVRIRDRIDFDTSSPLQNGVRLLGGEPRARYVYTASGATADVASRWKDVLGEAFDVRTRESAIEAGWFGPTVSSAAMRRIGDLVVVADSASAIVRSKVESSAAALEGHHGSLTPAEMNVPAIVVRGG